MRYVLIILMLPTYCFSQESNKWKDDYTHFEGSYEDDFSCNKTFTRKQKKSINNFPYGDYCGHINVSLSVTGRYNILLDQQFVVGDSLKSEVFEFEGSFTVDSAGTLILHGPHPFSQDKFILKERISRNKGERYISGRGFKYQFKEDYLWISRKKRHTYCDGCMLTPD